MREWVSGAGESCRSISAGVSGRSGSRVPPEQHKLVAENQSLKFSIQETAPAQFVLTAMTSHPRICSNADASRTS